MLEATTMQEQRLEGNQCYTRSYLDTPNWGSDKHWEVLASDLMRFFIDVYILPVAWVKRLIEPVFEEKIFLQNKVCLRIPLPKNN